MGRRTGVAIFASAMLAAGGAFAADAPAALVLDYSGPPNPRLASFSELADGTELALGSGDTLTLLHYRTCKQVTITGGKVKVGVPRLAVEGGRKTEEPGEQCPQEVKVATAGVSGGVLMRSVAVFVLPARVDCTVVGARRAEVGSIEIAATGALPLVLPAAGGRVVAPEAAEPLAAGEYGLAVRALSGEPLKTLPVTVLEDAPADKLCLIRVE